MLVFDLVMDVCLQKTNEKNNEDFFTANFLSICIMFTMVACWEVICTIISLPKDTWENTK